MAREPELGLPQGGREALIVRVGRDRHRPPPRTPHEHGPGRPCRRDQERERGANAFHGRPNQHQDHENEREIVTLDENSLSIAASPQRP